MKVGCALGLLLLLVVGGTGLGVAGAQARGGYGGAGAQARDGYGGAGAQARGEGDSGASVYANFTYTDLGNSLGVENLFGGTLGLLYEVPTPLHRVVLSADVQGRFVRNNYDTLEGINVGPRFSLPLGRGYTPYAEFMVGFARFSASPSSTATTDSTLQVNGGVGRQLSPHFDATAEYSYSRYFGLFGQYVPQSISVGAVYHFARREMPYAAPHDGKGARTRPAATALPIGTAK